MAVKHSLQDTAVKDFLDLTLDLWSDPLDV